MFLGALLLAVLCHAMLQTGQTLSYDLTMELLRNRTQPDHTYVSLPVHPVNRTSWETLEATLFKAKHFPTVKRDTILRALSPNGYMGNITRLHEAVSTAVKKQDFVIAIVGGSVASGRGSPKGTAWPSALERYLRQVFHFDVHILNLALRAQPSQTQAEFSFKNYKAYIAAADLIIVDITANDRANDPRVRAHFGKRHHSADPPVHNYDKYYEFAEGKLLMNLLQMYSRPMSAILYVEVHTSSERISPILKTRADIEAEAASFPCGDPRRAVNCSYVNNMTLLSQCPAAVDTYPHWMSLVQYKIPVLSFPTVSCETIGTGKDKYWPEIHPPAESHDYLAKILVASIFEMSAEELPDYTASDGPIRDPVLRDQIADWNQYIYSGNGFNRGSSDADLKDTICASSPVSDMSVVHSKRFQPLRRGADWKYFEDVARKPGWICNQSPNRSNVEAESSAALDEDKVVLPEYIKFSSFKPSRRDIVFSVRTSEVLPRIVLQMLSSYDHRMGTVTCGVYNQTGMMTGGSPFVFNTRWSDHSSQAVGFDMNLKVDTVPTHKADAFLSFDILCRANSGKIKISAVVGC